MQPSWTESGEQASKPTVSVQRVLPIWPERAGVIPWTCVIGPGDGIPGKGLDTTRNNCLATAGSNEQAPGPGERGGYRCPFLEESASRLAVVRNRNGGVDLLVTRGKAQGAHGGRHHRAEPLPLPGAEGPRRPGATAATGSDP